MRISRFLTVEQITEIIINDFITNTYTQTIINNVLSNPNAPIGALANLLGVSHAAIVGLDGIQNIPKNAWTQILWDTTLLNRGNMVGSGGNAHKIIIPCDGIYVVSIALQWSGGAIADLTAKLWDQNYDAHLFYQAARAACTNPTTSPSGILYLSEGTSLKLAVFHNYTSASDVWSSEDDCRILSVVQIG